MNGLLRKPEVYYEPEKINNKQPTERISEENLESLLQEYRRPLLVCSSRTVNRFVTEHDEEWSVAVRAFYEAVQSYEEEKGEFWPFASGVVKRRLTDFLRSEYARSSVVPVAPEAFSGEQDAEDPAGGTEAEAGRNIAESSIEKGWPGQYTIADEIEAVQQELKKYDFSFYDLTACSPKAGKSRDKCAAAVAVLLEDRDLLGQMRTKRQLPMKEIEEKSGVSRKVLDKHRRYIIAAAEILDGDYPLLGEYLETLRKAMKQQ